MANRLTRVPDRRVPAMPGWARAAVPVADLFMLLMLSRPRSGSLSRTWVTPATLEMGVAVAVLWMLCVALVVAGLIHTGVAVLGIGTVLLLLAIGAGAVAMVGLAQHRG